MSDGRRAGDRVVVIGGGLAGIAAALRAADGGAQVTLLERRRRLGGLTWSFQRNGRSFDNGQHVFLRCCTAYRSLLERLGVADQVTMQRRLDVPVLAPGRRPGRIRRVALPAPLHLLPVLLGYPFLSRRERLALVPAMIALGRLDLTNQALDAETFGSWLTRHHQRARAVDGLWDLITLPTVNVPASHASLLLAATVFQTGLLASADAGDLGWAAVPLSELHDLPARRALARAGAEVRLGTTVSAVEPSGSERVDVVTGEGVLRAGAVIVAAPPEVAAQIFPRGSGLAEVPRLGTSPVVNVHVVLDRPVTDLPVVAVLSSPVQFVFARPVTSAGAGLGGAGEQVLVVSLSAAEDWIGMRAAELVRTMTGALTEVFPAMRRATVLDAVVTRERRATFRGVPGTASLRPGPASAVDGLYLAGAWTDTGWPATMEGAVRSGESAAALALGGHRAPATAPVVRVPDPSTRRDERRVPEEVST